MRNWWSKAASVKDEWDEPNPDYSTVGQHPPVNITRHQQFRESLQRRMQDMEDRDAQKELIARYLQKGLIEKIQLTKDVHRLECDMMEFERGSVEDHCFLEQLQHRTPKDKKTPHLLTKQQKNAKDNLVSKMVERWVKLRQAKGVDKVTEEDTRNVLLRVRNCV